MKTILKVDSVSKKFSMQLRDSVKYGLIDLGRKILMPKYEQNYLREGEFWALKNISFELNSGDSLGIMGKNGSGKSTLLKIIANLLGPTNGKISVIGNIQSLIAAGAGFSSNLTGLENIYLNSLITGSTRAEVKNKEQEIIDFSGLEEYINMPIKNYSSGMVVRLGFAIAASSKPEVLIVDEVLAVGDLEFQIKCYKRLEELRNNGTTLLFVSHSQSAIWSVCNKGIYLENGTSSGIDSIDSVIGKYFHKNSDNSKGGVIGYENEAGKIRNLSSEIDNNRLIITAELSVSGEYQDLYVHFSIDSAYFRSIATFNTISIASPIYLPTRPGKYKLEIQIPDLNLRPGQYSINASILRKSVPVHISLYPRISEINIELEHDYLINDLGSPSVIDYKPELKLNAI